MKLWLVSGTVLFFLFLVFFSRQFARYNWFFSAWLFSGVALQVVFAVAFALGVRPRVPELPLDIAGWILIALAMLSAHRRPDAVNQIILSGLAATSLLQIVALTAGGWQTLPAPARSLVSNLAGLIPTLYMLARFSTVYCDRLPLWVQRIQDSGFRIQASAAARAAVGLARSVFL